MDNSKEEQIKALAAQLRQPGGTFGKEVAERMNKGNRLMNLETIKQLHVGDNDRILEIGMGNGYFVNDILSSANNVTYVGCDTSNEMVEQATAINSEWVNKRQASFIAGDAHHLPFPDNHFQKIFTVNTIYFWENPKKVFNEFRRTLTEDGIFILTIRPKSVMEKMPVTKYGFSIFSTESATQLLADNGFTVINVVEKEDEDVKFQELVIKNAYIVITASKAN